MKALKRRGFTNQGSTLLGGSGRFGKYSHNRPL